MKKLIIDQGYSSAKIKYDEKLYKLPTAVAFATDVGIAYGEEQIFDYCGEKYYVGDEAVSSEAFSTTDYAFKSTYDPLLLFSILKRFNLIEDAVKNNIKLYLTLALADWKHKDEYLKIFKNFEVNGITLGFDDIVLMPQGAGSYIQFMQGREEHPESAAVIDIGANTVNLLAYSEGQPAKAHSRGFPGHGVMVSIIQPFTSYLETQFNMQFSNAEALKIFTKNKFIYNGSEQPQVRDKITELKGQFVKKLFNSVLTSEKKLLATTEKVIFCGGGVYLLEGISFPPNVVLAKKPYEFSNIQAV
jgi:hypothetical protein